MPPIAVVVARLRVSVTPRRTGFWPVLLTTPIPPPLRALLPVIVESWIVTAVAEVWPSMWMPPPVSFAVVPDALLVSISEAEMVSAVAPWVAIPPPRGALPSVIRTRLSVSGRLTLRPDVAADAGGRPAAAQRHVVDDDGGAGPERQHAERGPRRRPG